MDGKFLPVKRVQLAPNAVRLQAPKGIPLKQTSILPPKLIKFSVSQGGLQSIKKVT